MAKKKRKSRKPAKRSKKMAKSSKKAVHRKSTKKRARKTSKPTKKIEKTVKPKAASGKFNLLVSFNPSHAGMAETELNEVLSKIGEKPKITLTSAEGLFKVAVSDARKVVGRLRNLCQADPNMFVATHHYTPIDTWCKSEVTQMQKCVKSAASAISQSDRWKMQLAKRHWKKLDGTELIIKLTEVIDREHVDLKNPQKIVQVEIIERDAGISLLAPEDILDVEKVKEKS